MTDTQISTPATEAPPIDGDSDAETIVRSLEDSFRRTAASVTPVRLRSRYRVLLDAIAVAVYATDAWGGITFYNKAAAELWGRRPDLGEAWCGSWKLYDLDGRSMAHSDCPMAVALREGRAVRGARAVAERPDGTRVVFMPYPTPLWNDDGVMVGAVNVLVDITERHRAETEMRETAAALEASNAVKDEFLGLVSHELRTPVTTIFGNAHVLRSRADNLAPEQRLALLDDMVGEAERLRDIVENLLLLTRLGAGERPDSEPVLLAQVIERVVGSFRRVHGAHEVVLSDLPRDVVVEAEPTSLGQVLENLLSNAAKYSDPEAPIDLVVESTPDEVRVRILDRGIGLDCADAAELFSAFYRSPAAKKRAAGVGIGLAVCKRIIDADGGRIWAQPRAGGGAEFGFALPIASEGRGRA